VPYVNGVSGTGASGAAAATGMAAATKPTNELDKDAFLKLLVAQLKYQNPLSPTDPESLMSQTAQYSTVEQLQQLTKLMSDSARSQSLTAAAAMVGHDVVAKDADGVKLQGRVDSVSRDTDGSILLHLGTHAVALDDVSQVS
jgi:flagellar basal-body rod modification protein FlgD